MLTFLAAMALGSSLQSNLDNLIPTVNLSAVRRIECDDGWYGSGYLVRENVIMTDLHVASLKNCVDGETGKKLKTYRTDKDHDLALMTGKLPKMPYIKLSCERYKKGQRYMAYGISDYMFDGPALFRQVALEGTGEYKSFDFEDGGSAIRISYLRGSTVPGMSGGMILDENGYSHGNVVAGTEDFLGLPVGKSYSYEFADTFICKP